MSGSSETSIAVRDLRRALGETQESLARRMSLTVRTIARYESDQPPTGRALQRFIKLAREAGQEDLEAKFWRLLEQEFGLNAARQISNFRLYVLEARGMLLDLNAEDLTVPKAREVGHAVSSLLAKLESELKELDPYSATTPKDGDAEE